MTCSSYTLSSQHRVQGPALVCLAQNSTGAELQPPFQKQTTWRTSSQERWKRIVNGCVGHASKPCFRVLLLLHFPPTSLEKLSAAEASEAIVRNVKARPQLSAKDCWHGCELRLASGSLQNKMTARTGYFPLAVHILRTSRCDRQ